MNLIDLQCMLCCLVDIVSTGVMTNTSNLFPVTYKSYMAARWLTAIVLHVTAVRACKVQV
jgi:hypothetical protein